VNVIVTVGHRDLPVRPTSAHHPSIGHTALIADTWEPPLARSGVPVLSGQTITIGGTGLDVAVRVALFVTSFNDTTSGQ
jgi:hypothetical protein